MKTTKEWLDEIKLDKTKFDAWLVRQYLGEVTAAARMRELVSKYETSSKAANTVELIAKQEETHAEWVLSLLKTRGIVPALAETEARYWAETLPGIDSFDTGCAVAAHAEKMRLERIQAIVNDYEMPEDVRNVFKKILPQEEWHERAFRNMASDKAMLKTKGNHELGKKALGLES